MHPFHNLSVFGSSLFSAMHGSLVTSTLLSESIAQLSSGYVYVRKIRRIPYPSSRLLRTSAVSIL